MHLLTNSASKWSVIAHRVMNAIVSGAEGCVSSRAIEDRAFLEMQLGPRSHNLLNTFASSLALYCSRHGTGSSLVLCSHARSCCRRSRIVCCALCTVALGGLLKLLPQFSILVMTVCAASFFMVWNSSPLVCSLIIVTPFSLSITMMWLPFSDAHSDLSNGCWINGVCAFGLG